MLKETFGDQSIIKTRTFQWLSVPNMAVSLRKKQRFGHVSEKNIEKV